MVLEWQSSSGIGYVPCRIVLFSPYGRMKVKVTQSWLTLCDPMDYTVLGILQAGILEWVAFPFSWDLPNPGINPGLPHCRQILYQLSHKGSPRILEWVASSFSSRSSWHRNRTGVSCISGGFFTKCAIREAQLQYKVNKIAFGEGKSYPLQYSGLENSKDCIVHGVTKCQTRLSDLHFQAI